MAVAAMSAAATKAVATGAPAVLAAEGEAVGSASRAAAAAASGAGAAGYAGGDPSPPPPPHRSTSRWSKRWVGRTCCGRSWPAVDRAEIAGAETTAGLAGVASATTKNMKL